MDFASAKLIGAGLAAIGAGAAAIGVGIVFGSFLESALRNPAAADGQQGRLFIGFAARRAARPDGVHRRDAHPLRFVKAERARRRPGQAMPQTHAASLNLLRRSSSGWRSCSASSSSCIGRGMVPKIQATVDAREKKIADDLEARAGRRGPRPTRPKRRGARGWTPRAPRPRASPTRPSRPAPGNRGQGQGRGREDQPARSRRPKRKIRDAVEAARAEIEAVAAEATQEMVARLTGIKVDKKEAAEAVKAELNV